MLKLNQFIKEEWVEKGNIESEFDQSEMRIVIVLDNASDHKKQEVIAKLSQECPNLELWFLPPYSPDYNLIEWVWHSCKVISTKESPSRRIERVTGSTLESRRTED
jgi:transposase